MSIYERPDYEVLLSEDSFELRHYKDFYIVEYDNLTDPDIENGFGSLFRYISKDNKAHQKISMTVPVIEEIAGDHMKMAFVVPKAQWENIPEPNNKFLSVQKFESGLFAVRKYGGLSSPKKEHKMIEELENWADSKNYRIVSNFMLAFFNGPFTPPMIRHNEIMVRIDR